MARPNTRGYKSWKWNPSDGKWHYVTTRAYYKRKPKRWRRYRVR